MPGNAYTPWPCVPLGCLGTNARCSGYHHDLIDDLQGAAVLEKVSAFDALHHPELQVSHPSGLLMVCL